MRAAVGAGTTHASAITDDETWTAAETRKGAELRLSYTTVEGGGRSGGGRPTQFGMIDMRGDQESAPQPIFFADRVTMKDRSRSASGCARAARSPTARRSSRSLAAPC